jgi:hypothetical protein
VSSAVRSLLGWPEASACARSSPLRGRRAGLRPPFVGSSNVAFLNGVFLVIERWANHARGFDPFKPRW